MPRTPQDRHPALAQQRLSSQIAVQDDENIAGIHGWETFTPRQKDILLVLPWFGNITDAWRFVRPNDTAKSKTIQNEMSKNSALQEAVQVRKQFKIDIARNMGADMLGLALFHIKHFLEDKEVTDTNRMKAIELTLKMNPEFNQPLSPFGGGNVINIGPGATFHGARSDAPDIEAEAVIVDG